LTEAIATGGQLAPLLDALKGRQSPRDVIASTLATLQSFDGKQFDRKAIDAQVREHLAGWRALLTGDAGAARAVVNSSAKCWEDRSRSGRTAENIGLKGKP
jgi:hypothetical protein